MSVKEVLRKIDEARAKGNELAVKWYLKLYLRAKAHADFEIDFREEG